MTFLISISLWLVDGLLKYQPSTEQNPPTGLPVFTCPSCGSHHTIKNGYLPKGKPKRHCQECGQPSVINPTNKNYRDWETDRKSTRLNSSHSAKSRMPSSA